MGANAETHSQTLCKEWETLEPSAINEVSLSNPSPQTQGTLQKSWKQCKSQKRWSTPRKQGPLNQHEFQRLRQHAQGVHGLDSTRWGPRAKRSSEHTPPSITQRLSPTDTQVYRGNKALLRVGCIPSSRQLTVNKFFSNLSFYFYFFLLFYSTGLLHICLWLPDLCFYGNEYANTGSLCLNLFLVPFLDLFSFYFFWPIPMCLFLFYLVWLLSLISLFIFQWETDLDGRGVGEELAGTEGGETIIRIHCMEKCFQ